MHAQISKPTEQPQQFNKNSVQTNNKPNAQQFPQRERSPLQVDVAPSTDSPNLEQLRSILSKISAKEKSAPQKNTRRGNNRSGNQNNNRNNDRRPQPFDSRRNQPQQTAVKDTSLDLKSVLAQAMNAQVSNTEVAQNEKPKSTQPAVHTNNVSPKIKQTDPLPKSQPAQRQQSAAIQQNQTQPQSARADHKDVPQQQPTPVKNDEVSPKELERMMRVTTNDRPPLQ